MFLSWFFSYHHPLWCFVCIFVCKSNPEWSTRQSVCHYIGLTGMNEQPWWWWWWIFTCLSIIIFKVLECVRIFLLSIIKNKHEIRVNEANKSECNIKKDPLILLLLHFYESFFVFGLRMNWVGRKVQGICVGYEKWTV